MEEIEENFKELFEISKEIFNDYEEDYTYIEINRPYLNNYEERLSDFIDKINSAGLKKREKEIYSIIGNDLLSIHAAFKLLEQYEKENTDNILKPVFMRIRNSLYNLLYLSPTEELIIGKEGFMKDKKFQLLLEHGVSEEEAITFVRNIRYDFLNSVAHRSITVINQAISELADEYDYDYIKYVRIKAHIAFTKGDILEDDLIETRYRTVENCLDEEIAIDYGLNSDLVNLYLNMSALEAINNNLSVISKLDVGHESTLFLTEFKSLILFLSDDNLQMLYKKIDSMPFKSIEVQDELFKAINNIDKDRLIHNDNLKELEYNMDEEPLSYLNKIAKITFKIAAVYLRLFYLELFKDGLSDYEKQKKDLIDTLVLLKGDEDDLYSYFEENSPYIFEALSLFDGAAIYVVDKIQSLCQYRMINRLSSIALKYGMAEHDEDMLDEYRSKEFFINLKQYGYEEDDLFDFIERFFPVMNKSQIVHYIATLDNEMINSTPSLYFRYLHLKFDKIFENGVFLEDEMIQSDFKSNNLKLHEELNISDVDSELIKQYLDSKMPEDIILTMPLLSSFDDIKEGLDELLWFKTYLVYIDDCNLKSIRDMVTSANYKSPTIKNMLLEAIDNIDKLRGLHNRDSKEKLK